MESVLRIGIPIEKKIDAGVAESFYFELDAQDLVKILIETDDPASIATMFAPDGASFRQFLNDGAAQHQLFYLAQQSGQYRLNLKASSDSFSKRCVVMLEKIIPLAERLIAPPAPECRLLKELRDNLQKGPTEALKKFWRAVEKIGTPIFEPIENDEANLLATFIWRGDEATRSVIVSIPPYSRIAKDRFTMTHLVGTDVWAVTAKLPERSRFLYSFVINAPFATSGPDSSREEIGIFQASSQPDPFNARRLGNSNKAKNLEARSIFEPPGARPQYWIDPRSESTPGKLEQAVLKSRTLGNERTVSVYTPPADSNQSSPLPLLVLFDENVYVKEINAAVILDNLIAESLIPPMIAVFIGNAPGARRHELACNPHFAKFVSEELRGWITDSYNVTSDPDQTILGGASLGGVAAAFTALHHPDRFGNVLSQSGSFWWKRNEPTSPNATETTAIVALVLSKPTQPVRFYLDAGTDEIELPGRGLGILNANRHLRDVLYAKGYQVLYQEFAGGHGSINWRGTLADGLIGLTKSFTQS